MSNRQRIQRAKGKWWSIRKRKHKTTLFFKRQELKVNFQSSHAEIIWKQGRSLVMAGYGTDLQFIVIFSFTHH